MKNPALEALRQNCVFRSHERVEAHEQVALELAEHSLRWKRGVSDTALHKGVLNRLQVYTLQYGAEVEVKPAPFDDFVLVHTSLVGGAEIECDGHRLEVAEGRSAVLAPERSVRLRWYEGTQQLILKVPKSLINEICTGDADSSVGKLAPGYLVPREQSSQWDLISHSLLNAMSIPVRTPAHRAWLDHFERNVAMFLLTHQPDPESRPAAARILLLPEASGGLAPAKESARMEAVLEYMDARLSAPVSLEDLARVAGISVRTLNELCRRHHGATPMELLRNMRLDAVRQCLRLKPGASITETALSFGFGHLGRFSHYYFSRFGELPRQTQVRQSD